MSFVTLKKMNLRATAHCLMTKCLSKNLLKIQSQKYPLEEGKTEKGGLHGTRPSVPGQQCQGRLGGPLAKPEAGNDDGRRPLPMGAISRAPPRHTSLRPAKPFAHITATGPRVPCDFCPSFYRGGV